MARADLSGQRQPWSPLAVQTNGRLHGNVHIVVVLSCCYHVAKLVLVELVCVGWPRSPQSRCAPAESLVDVASL